MPYEDEKIRKEKDAKMEKYEKPRITKYSRKRRITSVAGATSSAFIAATLT